MDVGVSRDAPKIRTTRTTWSHISYGTHVKFLRLTDSEGQAPAFPPAPGPSHATDGKLLVLCHLGLELRRGSVSLQAFLEQDRFSMIFRHVGELATDRWRLVALFFFPDLLNQKSFFWEMVINGDDQFFFELVGFSRGIGLDLHVSAVSFPSPPPRKIRKNHPLLASVFLTVDFSLKPKAFSNLAAKKNRRLFPGLHEYASDQLIDCHHLGHLQGSSKSWRVWRSRFLAEGKAGKLGTKIFSWHGGCT